MMTKSDMAIAYPEVVQALGMLSIESSNVETELCWLLASLLTVNLDVAKAIYFSPNGQMARMTIIKNVAALPRYSAHQKDISVILKRADARFAKRHTLMHALWTHESTTQGPEVIYSGPAYEVRPHGETFRTDAKELNAAIQSMRLLMQDIRDLSSKIKEARQAQRLLAEKLAEETAKWRRRRKTLNPPKRP
jgi:hypothetical protein